MFGKRLKRSIRSKILSLVMTLTLGILVVVAAITVSTINDLGNYSSESSMNLGNLASARSSSAIKKQTELLLVHIVKDQASLSNELMKQIAESVSLMAERASLSRSTPVLAYNSRKMLDYTKKQVNRFRMGLSPDGSDSNGSKGLFAVSPEMDQDPKAKKRNILIKSDTGLAPAYDPPSYQMDRVQSVLMDSVFMRVYKGDEKLFHRLMMAGESGFYRYYPGVDPPDKKYDPRRQGWYRSAVKELNRAVWIQPHKSKCCNDIIFTCAKAYRDLNGNVVGVTKADIKLETMNDEILNTKVGEFGFAFLINDKGVVIDYPGIAHQDKDAEKPFKTRKLLDIEDENLRNIVKDMVKGETGLRTCNLNGVVNYIAYAPIESTRWSLGIVLSEKVILKPMKKVQKDIKLNTEEAVVHIEWEKTKLKYWFGITACIFFILILYLGFRHSSRITSPIEKLDKGAAIIGKGNLDYRLDIKTGDEIEDLSETFNQMAGDLKGYMKHLRETIAEKERIMSDLRIAGEIQASLLPRTFPPFPQYKQFDIFASMVPAKEVGGDFYDFFIIDDKRLGFLIADVSGKGVPASLFMATTKTLIKNEALRGIPPFEVLRNANNTVVHDNDEMMFVTVFICVMDIETGKIEYANAGHNPPLTCRRGEAYEFLEEEKSFVLGPRENAKFATGTLQLEPGEAVFLYTDGVTEARNPEKEFFGNNRLKMALDLVEGNEPDEILGGVCHALREFVKDAEQSDDITMLALRYNKHISS